VDYRPCLDRPLHLAITDPEYPFFTPDIILVRSDISG
jgi:hypothetical protein